MTGEIKISVEELLKNPRAFHQKKVWVKGYFVNEFENQSLWPSLEIYEQNDLRSSIWIEIDKKTRFFDKEANKSSPFSHKIGLIKGTFIYEPISVDGMTFGHGHMSGWPAEIQKIAFIQVLE